jgi:hypothetical protein
MLVGLRSKTSLGLQREYGYYELAYLETLLRAADWLISSSEAGEQTDHV